MTDVILKEPCIIDVSHWEVIPDWTLLDKRVVGVIMKATQYKYYVDPTFRSSWNGTRQIKVPASAYHFFEPNDVSAQVENYLTACEDVGLIVGGKWVAEIEPVLDAEYSPTKTAKSVLVDSSQFSGKPLAKREKNAMDTLYSGRHLVMNRKLKKAIELNFAEATVPSPTQLAAQYKAWLDGVESELGIKPIIYTSSFTWVNAGNPSWSKDYKLWTAQYPYDPNGQTEPKYFPYSGWTEWMLWQYDEQFKMDGIDGFVDVNVYNGTAEEWKQQYGGEIVTPPPPQGDDMEVETNLGFNVTIRADHTTSSASLGTLVAGQKRTVLEQPWEKAGTKGVDYEQWAKIPEGWVAVWYRTSGNAGHLCTLTGTLPPEPPPAGDVAVSVVVNGASAFSQTYPSGTEIVIKVL